MPHQKSLCQGVKPTDPITYELVVNYRSHGGIVNCARSVIELIVLYWPQSIDILSPERAFVDGPQPIFYSNQGNVICFVLIQKHPPINICANRGILRDLSLVMARGIWSNSERINVGGWLFLASRNSHMRLNTGIIVRDNAARQRLKKRLGESSIIM